MVIVFKGVRAPPPIASIVTNSCLNANAPSFVPSWLKKPEGSSYAEAAGAAPFVCFSFYITTLLFLGTTGQNIAESDNCESI